MTRFSERYRYVKPSEVFLRETMTDEIANAICSCYDLLEKLLDSRFTYGNSDDTFEQLELFLWTNFLNNRRNDFYCGYRKRKIVATEVILDKNVEWYWKLDIVEISAKWLFAMGERDQGLRKISMQFMGLINHEFERLNYAYRFVEKEIMEITSEEEVKTIEKAIADNTDNIKRHLSKALELCAKRPTGDYGNSIKESISAVEALCRKKTGEDTLGKALNKLEDSGVVIPKLLKTAFDKLYAYTNQPDTGIRHALMDGEGTYTPSEPEAAFMLISCSAFINYLNKK